MGATRIARPEKRALIRPPVNDVYAKYLMPCKARWVFLFGSAGSGKSVAASQKIAMRLNSEPDTKHKALGVRKYYSDIEESMYDRVINELDSLGLSSRWKVTKKPLKIAQKPPRGGRSQDQSKMIFRGIDDSEKIKSLEGITIIWIEEGTQLSEQEFLQLDLRLRGVTNGYYQIIVSFNPVSENHWIAKYAEPQMFDEEDRHEGTGVVKVLVPDKVWEYKRISEVDGKKFETVVRSINTTYKDNRFLPAEYKATLESMSGTLGDMYVVYALGRWSTGTKEGKFFPTFDFAKHTRMPAKLAYDPTKPIHLSIDFNVRPYMSGLLSQMEWKNGYWNGYNRYLEVRFFDEIAAKSPLNTAYGLGQTFEANYPNSGAFYLYGDATGVRGLGVKDTKSLFEDFSRGLGSLAGFAVERIPASNPRYKAISKGALGRKAFCTRLFDGNTVPIRILVSKKCKNFIKDLQEVNSTAEGKIEKIKDKDGVEQLGHMSDCFAYYVCHPDALGAFAYSITKKTG